MSTHLPRIVAFAVAGAACVASTHPAAPFGARWVRAERLSPEPDTDARQAPSSGPRFERITPSRGVAAGGIEVRITGAGLTGLQGPAVRVGGRSATRVSVIDDGTLRLHVPEAHAADVGRALDVSVLTQDGRSYVLQGAFTYAADGAPPEDARPPASLTVREEQPEEAHLSLPAIPALPPLPLTRPDGTFTVEGLRLAARRHPELWNTTQTVRGWIARVYVPRLEDGRLCTPADHCSEERPHVYLADGPTETRDDALMIVTGYASFQSDLDRARAPRRPGRARPVPPASPAVPTDLLQGVEVSVTGRLVRSADNGMADSEGLLVYASHVTHVVPAVAGPARPAARHP